MILGLSVLVLVGAMQRWAPRWPGPLMGVLCAAAVLAIFTLGRYGVDVVGPVPVGLPLPGMPELSRQAAARWPQSTKHQGPSVGSCSMSRPTSRWI